MRRIHLESHPHQCLRRRLRRQVELLDGIEEVGMCLACACRVGGNFGLDIAQSTLDVLLLGGMVRSIDTIHPIDPINGGHVTIDRMHDGGGDENENDNDNEDICQCRATHIFDSICTKCTV